MIPDFQSLMLPVLRSSENGEVKVSDVVKRLADDFHLSPDERTQFLKSGQTRFENVLIDGIQLARLMIRHHVGCRVEETLSIMELDEEFFE